MNMGTFNVQDVQFLPVLKDYVIRDMQTGLFLNKVNKNGEPMWIKNRPRRFKRLSDLSSFLNVNFKVVPTTWEVIEFRLEENSRFSAAVLHKR